MSEDAAPPSIVMTHRTSAEWHAPWLASRDAPLVIAFAREWTSAGAAEHELAAIRSELRGLGAVLVVVSNAGIWHFRPDDDIERFALGRDGAESEIARLAALCDAPRARNGHFADVVFVIEPSGNVRLASAGPPNGVSIHVHLARALAAAGRAIAAASTPPLMLSRREWVTSVLLAGFAMAAAESCGPATPALTTLKTGAADSSAVTSAAGELDIVLEVNGAPRAVRVEPRVSLLDALRERLGLTGSKKGCDHGQCGACTVLVDGRRVCSCLMFAVMAQGSKITTIEGLARGDDLHPLQAAFLAQDGLQCGYCTPGQIMSGVGLIAEGRARTDDEVREQMSGNLCRCGAYPNIVAAIQLGRKGV